MSNPSPSSTLPRWVEPRKLAGQGAILSGIIAATELPRVVEAAVVATAPVDVQLKFDCGPNGARTLCGRVQTQVELVCQRCLEPFAYQLMAEVAVGIVVDDRQSLQLPSELDPWLVQSEPADLYELVEDELLLALPIVARHLPEVCTRSGFYAVGTGDVNRTNPFAVLADLEQQK